MAGEYPCSNIDLLGHLSTDDLLAEEQSGILLNDIWGWTDPDTGKEYAIVGMANGTSFVDISDPENPLMLGILPEHHQAGSHKSSGKPEHDGGKSIWRDIKVYQNHAYIVSEDAGHGMQVFDLTDLRNVTNAPEEFLEAGHYAGISNAHNIVINETTGFAYAVGATGSSVCGQGGLHIINIQDPKNPVYEACFDDDGYTHDAQCVIYNGPDTDYQGKEICFNSNEDTITIVNVDDKSDIQQISRTGYDGATYTHQGWLTEDHKYFISNDELDELNRGKNTTTFVWDVQNLDEPILLGTYVHGTKVIDHNLYIVENEIYESNYNSGLRVLDLSNVGAGKLSQIAYFDTYPLDDATEFNGTWSNYPFFESKVIAVSDITNGLFLLKLSDTFKTHILSQPQDIDACVGEHFDMTIEAVGKDVSYRWQIDTGSGFEDITDFTNYNNTYSRSLHIHEVDLNQNDYKFRCKITSPGNPDIYTEVATLSVDSPPIVDFDYSYSENIVQYFNLTLFGDTYTWNFGDGSLVSRDESPIHEYDKSILEYDVSLRARNDCGADEMVKKINFVITGNDLGNKDVEIKLFPIPANNYLNIIDLKNELESYEIHNLSGLMIQKDEIFGTEFQINLKNLSAGIYVIEFQKTNGEKLIRRIIIK